MVIKNCTLQMHQAQHSKSSYPQYPNDQHTTSTNSTIHQGSWNRHDKHQNPTQPDLETTKSGGKYSQEMCRLHTLGTNVFESPVSAPREQGYISTHRKRVGKLWEQLLHGWDHPLLLLSQLIYEASVYSPHQQIPPLQPQTCPFHWTGKESLLSYSVFYTTG